jgi:hypothetical protein
MAMQTNPTSMAGEGSMKMRRRRFLQLASLAAALPALPRIASALDYPTRPVRIIAGFAAGGGVDITARLIGQWLGDRLGQSFVTENRPGAGGNIGTEAVINAAPDGYTLLLATVPNAVNASLYPKLNFNFIRDIAAIGGIIRVPMIIMVHPDVPYKTVPELIAYAKANPGKISMASAGNGSAPHMAGELFKMMAGVDMLHVPYRGQGPAMTDLLSGQVQLLFAHRARHHRLCEDRQAARAGCDDGDARRGDAGAAANRGLRGGLRDQPVVWPVRAEGGAGSDRHHAQPRDQRSDCRFRPEEAP